MQRHGKMETSNATSILHLVEEKKQTNRIQRQGTAATSNDTAASLRSHSFVQQFLRSLRSTTKQPALSSAEKIHLQTEKDKNRERKRQINRLSAQRKRFRERDLTVDLSQDLRQLTSTNLELRNEGKELRNLISTIRNNGDLPHQLSLSPIIAASIIVQHNTTSVAVDGPPPHQQIPTTALSSSQSNSLPTIKASPFAFTPSNEMPLPIQRQHHQLQQQPQWQDLVALKQQAPAYANSQKCSGEQVKATASLHPLSNVLVPTNVPRIEDEAYVVPPSYCHFTEQLLHPSIQDLVCGTNSVSKMPLPQYNGLHVPNAQHLHYLDLFLLQAPHPTSAVHSSYSPSNFASHDTLPNSIPPSMQHCIPSTFDLLHMPAPAQIPIFETGSIQRQTLLDQQTETFSCSQRQEHCLAPQGQQDIAQNPLLQQQAPIFPESPQQKMFYSLSLAEQQQWVIQLLQSAASVPQGQMVRFKSTWLPQTMPWQHDQQAQPSNFAHAAAPVSEESPPVVNSCLSDSPQQSERFNRLMAVLQDNMPPAASPLFVDE